MTITPLPSRQLPWNYLSGLLRTTLNPNPLPAWITYSFHIHPAPPHPHWSRGEKKTTPWCFWLILDGIEYYFATAASRIEHQHLQLGPGPPHREKADCQNRQHPTPSQWAHTQPFSQHRENKGSVNQLSTKHCCWESKAPNSLGSISGKTWSPKTTFQP